jgi:hypothetical protein
MRYVVLYAASCPACSEVARLVGNASITDLEARPFEDPQVTESLRKAGLVAPDRPSLMVISETDVQLLSGWAMRSRLAGLVGWRRSRTIVRLLAAEWRARLAKSAASHVPSRRGVIGGLLAGLAGWAMSSGVANASATPPEGTPAMKPADPAAAARVLGTATAQQAVRTWGPAEQQVLEISGGSQPVLVLTHAERDIYTFIDNSPGAHSSEPVAISLGAAPTAEHALRYYTVNGGALADVKVSNGRAVITPVQPGPGEAVPNIAKWQIVCWLGCIGRKTTSPGCITACENCFYYAVGSLARVIACSQCVVCAGPDGVACLRECAII